MVLGFNITVSWKVVAVAFLLGAATGFGGGYYAADTVGSLKAARLEKQEIEAVNLVLKSKIKEQQDVLQQDYDAYQQSQLDLEQMKKDNDELKSKISTGVGLSASDVDSLRQHWPDARPVRNRKHKKSTFRFFGDRPK